jgi:polyphosphate glucokinase
MTLANKAEHTDAAVLVVDIGGSTVKLFSSTRGEVRRFESGPALTPAHLIAAVAEHTRDWPYQLVSIGYPGKVKANKPCEEPGNLGSGWSSFDFTAAFGCPVRVVNDASLQAIGGYAGGTMLFLGLGTGLGSALVVEHTVVELDLGGLPYGPAEILSDKLGHQGLERDGKATWLATLNVVVERLRHSFLADYVLLGGGHADEVDPLPELARRGGNDDAFIGGVLLWRDGFEDHAGWRQRGSNVWRLLREAQGEIT